MNEQDERKDSEEVKQVELKAYYTPAETAEILGLDVKTLRVLRFREELMGEKVNERAYVYRREEIEKVAENRGIKLDFVSVK